MLHSLLRVQYDRTQTARVRTPHQAARAVIVSFYRGQTVLARMDRPRPSPPQLPGTTAIGEAFFRAVGGSSRAGRRKRGMWCG
jgi:hypothetical protein